jgi:hypothetical protein
MEHDPRIMYALCQASNCEFLKTSNGQQYCAAYYPDCDEYLLFERYLAIEGNYHKLKTEVETIRSKLREKGITIPIRDLSNVVEGD